MPGIYHNFVVNAATSEVFNGVSTSKGLNVWWTKESEGKPIIGSIYNLDFGPGYIWKAIVTKSIENKEFELQITEADSDWMGTLIGFLLRSKNNITEVSFYHLNWTDENDHYKISCYCWAMYLRILKRNIEYGEIVPYEMRLNV